MFADTKSHREATAPAANSTTIIVPEDDGDDELDPMQSADSKTTTSAAAPATDDLGTPIGDDWTAEQRFCRQPLHRSTVFRCWLRLWRGDSRLLGRSANVVQVLGSITALCCVDKKGILSWPNPTAEKVFFLRDGDKEEEDRKKNAKLKEKQAERESAEAAAEQNRRAKSEPPSTQKTAKIPSVATATAIVSSTTTAETGQSAAAAATAATVPVVAAASQTSMDSDSSQPPLHHGQHKAANGTGGGGAIAEVLDLTHDQHSPFRLAFDDHAWSQHLQSLKPLGLAILVNTCCPLTQAHYAQFCNHVTAVAMLDKDLVPVTNRYEIVESRLNSFMHGYVFPLFVCSFILHSSSFLFSFRCQFCLRFKN